MNDIKNDIDKENEKYLTHHEYDGIQECDYPLPSWWVASFWITTIIGVGYFIYYQLGSGPTLLDELKEEMGIYNSKKAVIAAKAGGFDQAKYDSYASTPEKMKLGEETYNTMCVACHKPLGAGDIGPNLSDNYWKNGDGSPSAIFSTIKNGVPDKGMPGWGPIIGEEKNYAAAAYVKSLKGGKVEKPKAPEGNLFE